MAKTYTVVKGDCLWTIAKEQLGKGSRWGEITRPNNVAIKSPYTIYPGETLWLPDGSGGSDPVNNTNRPTDVFVGLMAGSNNLYATWVWNKTNTKSYSVKWYYDTGNKVWFVGNESTIEITDKDHPDDYKRSIYSIPDNANYVLFRVKPVSETYKVNNTDTSYWTAEWSKEVMIDISTTPPSTPSVPSVTLKSLQLTAELNNLDPKIEGIQFQVIKNDTDQFNVGKVAITATNSVSYSCNVVAGGSYKVRCRSYRKNVYSEWSDFSDKVTTIPGTPGKITVCRASSSTSVYLEWLASGAIDTYDIEYTNKKEYFDGSNATTTISGIEQKHYEITGLESGLEYFFRVRSVNENGESGWSGIASVTIGKKPTAPTTWSSTSRVITGEVLTLYWVHNSEDNSKSTFSEIEIYFGSTRKTYTVESEKIPEDEVEKTHSFYVDTTSYPEGTIVKWRVRTAGVTKEYGEWSVQRIVDIYAPATLTLNVTDVSGNAFDTLTSLPFRVRAIHGPNTQAPISYHLTVRSGSSYETVDNTGNRKVVSVGDDVYSKHFDISTSLDVTLSAGDIDLVNNAQYTVICVVSLNSGLTATANTDFVVQWTDEEYQPNAEIGFDRDTYSAYIRPFCKDENDKLIDGILLSVYRREFDGSFTELIKDVDNTKNNFIVDPHPALDFARYRIVAKTETTGAISYYDVPGYPVQEKAIIIQWNESWSSFDPTGGAELAQNPWTGSLLRLPYNIDISDSNTNEVSMVSYIGRSNPVAYYGTQNGSSSVWKVDIDKKDAETLYALRRLAIWMGDVYVREPSGSGYWANVSVSFNQTHGKLVIPVTINLKRVEGGV